MLGAEASSIESARRISGLASLSRLASWSSWARSLRALTYSDVQGLPSLHGVGVALG
jgi:hypothetical protein